LRSTDNSYISSPRIQGMEQMKVANLLCTERKNGKWEDIEVLVNERDREEIRNLALTNLDGSDKLI